MTTLELNDKELATVKEALDNHLRIHMGQAPQVMEKVTFAGVRTDGRTLTVEESLEAQHLLDRVAEILTGHKNGGPNIFSARVSNSARLAYRIIARISGDTLREGMVDEEGNTKER